ncbi:hypothetical protein RchiOBHm_Chr6g0249681 [Rosa chinensis]|uniref:Uncharacterized protein n=1 Tax=Rosa chinensis TaxID=74649 RepID=A0A2P6PKC5_ROSCH|nr:hypothetical protein RchiOBHm_Chr6g0249681 [Rosa chinensis]
MKIGVYATFTLHILLPCICSGKQIGTELEIEKQQRSLSCFSNIN